MSEPLLALSDRDLHELSLALQSGRLAPPFTRVAVGRVIAASVAGPAAESLRQLGDAGFGPAQMAITLELLRADRARRPPLERMLELVVTGPDVEGVATRDTSVVVRDLFVNAREEVLVAGYAVHQGQHVFHALADRMLEVPTLRVRLFLDIQRPHGDTTMAKQLIRRFSERFVNQQWPAERPLPELYFDSRSIVLDSEKRACLHAKVVVVDGREVFVSSANFTEAAQHRNIEAGVHFESHVIARHLTNYFEQLLRVGILAQARLTPPCD